MSTPFRRAVIRVVSPLLKGIYRLLGGYRVEGLKNVPATGGAILAPNHLSWADPPAIRAVIDRNCWFMANDFLFRIPVLGQIIPIFGAFPVRRGVLDREALRAAEGHLKDGDLLCIFPEGGTTITGRLYPFEGGVALLAIRNDVPVIPVAITGTDKVLPGHRPWPHYARGGVTVTFGEPIYPASVAPDLPRRERVDRLTEQLYQSVGRMLPPAYVPEDFGQRREPDGAEPQNVGERSHETA